MNARGQLSQEEIAKVKAWISENREDASRCPFCGCNGDMDVAPHVVQLSAWRPKSSDKRTLTYPAVMWACLRCGYMALLNALIVGVLETNAEDILQPVEKPSDEEKSNG